MLFHRDNAFRKDIEPRCSYCEYGSAISSERAVCVKKGVVDAAGHCSRFRYDPLKRVPPRPAELGGGHSPDEFKL